MSEENVNPNLEKMLNDQKWSFSAKPFEGAKGRPKLSFGVYMGNPNLVVFTNHPSDQGKKPLRLGLDMKTLGSYAQFIIDFAKTGKPGEAYALECRSGAPNALKHEGDFIIGKEQDGVIYIGAVKEGYTNVKFHVLPPMHHSIRSMSGEALGKAKLSEIWTVGYFTELVPVVRKLVELTYRAPEPRQGGYQKGGNGGGGYQKGGYNGGGGNYQKPQGGYQKPQGGGGYDDYSDDIPM